MFNKGYGYLVRSLDYLQSPFLLAIRLYWGWQFFQTGRGKLSNIAPVIEFFQSLGIPFPSLNAHLVGLIELMGGVSLLLGLGARLMGIPLTVAMTIAYLTADLEAVKSVFSNPDAFVQAAPFPFLMAALIVLLFGAGRISLDYIIGIFFTKDNVVYNDQSNKGGVPWQSCVR